MTVSQTTPRVGISACLLGQPVRYDGGDKAQPWLIGTLSRFVTWVPLCPELEMGLGAPRESMGLALDPATGDVRLLTTRSRRDLTGLARATAERLLRDAPALDGYILKSDSPSCGLARVPIRREGGRLRNAATGLFAASLRERCPALPLVEEGQLRDPAQRGHFLTRLFAAHRLRRLAPGGEALRRFHRGHESLLLSHSPGHCRTLGALLFGAEQRPAAVVRAEYAATFAAALALVSTPPKRVHALRHLLATLRARLAPAEQAEALRVIGAYRQGRMPLHAPLRLIERLLHDHGAPWAGAQAIFHSYPQELAE
ncbi:MAG: DUF1722 domain-containing protein [Candidatus Lambdaproteobacteria bacterium]|nr:DUF1722 domain-containing protein [Candidatus Lambdaproteobacteria bacterium]